MKQFSYIHKYQCSKLIATVSSITLVNIHFFLTSAPEIFESVLLFLPILYIPIREEDKDYENKFSRSCHANPSRTTSFIVRHESSLLKEYIASILKIFPVAVIITLFGCFVV